MTKNSDNFKPVVPPADSAAPTTATLNSNNPPSTSVFAILGLIGAFVMPILGLVFSIVGMVQTKDNKQGGRGLAVVGLILNLLFIVIGTVSLVLLVILAANAEDKTIRSSSSSSLSSEEKVSSVSIGEAAAADGIEVTVNSVNKTYSNAEYFLVPDEMSDYWQVDLKLLNTTSASKTYSDFDFELILNGETVYPAYYNANDRLRNGSIESNREVSGKMVFEVPKGTATAKLKYKPSFLSDEVVEISL